MFFFLLNGLFYFTSGVFLIICLCSDLQNQLNQQIIKYTDVSWLLLRFFYFLETEKKIIQ